MIEMNKIKISETLKINKRKNCGLSIGTLVNKNLFASISNLDVIVLEKMVSK